MNISVVHILLKNTGDIFALTLLTIKNDDPSNNAKSLIDSAKAIISI